MLTYATADDYKEWNDLEAVPANATALLRSASLAVREATSLDVYTTDDTGLPTDADKLQAMRDATLIQATALNALKIDAALGGVITPSTTTSKSINGASLSYSAAEVQAAATGKAQAAQALVSAAVQALRLAGLASNEPWRVG
ncbi:MAG: hypothetical protein LKJ05_02795 [Bifidobacteriaceae bacterium]|jgi:hypothetical protein|nr:hypothetical protein [Bifidobacteriaceae bacterium]